MQDDSEQEDLEWIRCIREDSFRESAYASLHGKYLGLILRFLAKQGFQQEASDLAQDIFFSAFKDLDAFEGRSTFRTWLIAIAANRCRQEWSRSNRLKRKAHLVDLGQEEGPTLEETVPSPALNPAEEALAKERQALLAAAVEELPPRMRQSFKLRSVGHDLKTIAALLKVQEGTVKAQLHHAREILAGKLGGDPDDG